MIATVLNTIKACDIEMIQISKEDIKRDKIGGEHAMFYLPKLQELLVCNIANTIARYTNNTIEFLPIKRYLELMGKTWSKKLDCQLGDIIVVRKGTLDVVVCIDLKVADDGEHTVYFPQHRLFVGCINKTSYDFFARGASGNTPHWYLCTSYNGAEFVIIDAIGLAEFIKVNSINIDGIYKTDKKGNLYIPSCWIFQNIQSLKEFNVLLFEKRL